MYIDTPLHGTDLYVILLCLLTTDIPLTVRHIFEDNHNWGAFRLAEKDNLRDVEINEVNKMLSCNSTLETQKTAAAIRLPLKSQNTED